MRKRAATNLEAVVFPMAMLAVLGTVLMLGRAFLAT